MNYRWLLSFIKPYRWMLAGFVACSLFVISVEMSVPKFIQYFIDVLMPAENLSLFMKLLAALAVLLVLMFAATATGSRLQRIIQEKAARDLQFKLFEHLRALGFSYYEKNPVGATLSLFGTETSAVKPLYQRYVPDMITMSFTLVVAFGFMLSIHVWMSLILLPCFFSYYLVGPYFEKRAAVLSKETNERRKAFQQKVYDTISALLELRVFRGGGWDLDRVTQRQKSLQDHTMKLHWTAYMRGLVRRVLVSFGAVAVFACGAYLIQAERITPGEMVAFIFYYFLAMQYLTYLVTSASEQKVLVLQARRLFDFIQEQPEVKESEQPVVLERIQGDLRFEGVSFRYPSQPSLIEDLSLDIRAGEKVALVGTSGHGKSTLIKLIGRFYDPQEGVIRLDGVPLRDLSLKQVREAMGYVFQETYLFGTSVRENIRFGNPEASDADIEEAARAAYAHDFIMELPQGYETPVGERGFRLSGGQKQRVAIARMLVKNPRIVLLDEATSALDNVSEREVQEALARLFENRTIIAVAHRLSTVRDFDRLILIEDGRVLESGTYDELMSRQGAFYRLATGGHSPETGDAGEVRPDEAGARERGEPA